MARIILHIDMDAFFAAIEQRDRPQLRGLPVIVGGRPGGRSVVSSASYEARACGVRSAMPTSEARRLCPQAVFVPVDMPRYAEASRQLMRVLGQFSPLVEPLSIDEAFLDMTGTERLFGGPEDMGRAIKAAVREALAVTASVGMAPSKFIAKLASDRDKPDGLVVVSEEHVQGFLRSLSIRALWGVGEATEKRLLRLGITTVARLADYPREVLVQHLGQMGEHLHDLANGIDGRSVDVEHEVKSVSTETTFGTDVADAQTLKSVLFHQAEEVAWRLRKSHLKGRTVTVKVRLSDFRTLTRSRSRAEPLDHGPEVYRVGEALLEAAALGGRAVRLIGIGVSHLATGGESGQLALFGEHDERDRKVDAAMDRIIERFGHGAVQRARRIGDSLDDRREDREG